MKELKKHMDLAVEILSKASDRTLAASREKKSMLTKLKLTSNQVNA